MKAPGDAGRAQGRGTSTTHSSVSPCASQVLRFDDYHQANHRASREDRRRALLLEYRWARERGATAKERLRILDAIAELIS